MNKEFKAKKFKDATVYTLESATSGGTSSGNIASVSSPMGGVRKRGDNLIAQEANKDTVPSTTPRNFVAKNAKMGGAGAHKDKKKAEKQGDVKHKNKQFELAEAGYGRNRDYSHGFGSPTAPKLGGREYYGQGAADDESNMLYIYVDGRLKQKMVSNQNERQARAQGFRDSQDEALKLHGIIRSKFDPKKFVQNQGGKWVQVFPYGEEQGVAEGYDTVTGVVGSSDWDMKGWKIKWGETDRSSGDYEKMYQGIVNKDGIHSEMSRSGFHFVVFTPINTGNTKVENKRQDIEVGLDHRVEVFDPNKNDWVMLSIQAKPADTSKDYGSSRPNKSGWQKPSKYGWTDYNPEESVAEGEYNPDTFVGKKGTYKGYGITQEGPYQWGISSSLRKFSTLAAAKRHIDKNMEEGVAEGSEQEKPIKKSDWFDPTDMRSPEKQKAAYLNHLAAKKKNKNIKEQGVAEEWSQKYKSSINCSHPKGFSQKAHCAGKKKHNEDMTMESVCPDCGMCQTHGNLSEIKKGAKDSNGFTKCWPGHHAAGTKKGKNGGQVRNCVPNTNEAANAAQQAAIAINIKKQGKKPKHMEDHSTASGGWGQGAYASGSKDTSRYTGAGHDDSVHENPDWYNDEANGMTTSQLKSLVKHAAKLRRAVKAMQAQGDTLEPWQQSKVTKAADYLDAVFNAVDDEHDMGEDSHPDEKEDKALIRKMVKAQALKQEDGYMAELQAKLDEKIPKNAPVDVWIKDFEKSNAPQFKGKTKEKRRQMAVAASYGAKNPSKKK